MSVPSWLIPKSQPVQKQSTSQVPEFLTPKKAKESPSILNELREVPSQFGQGAFTGAAGSYGDILDILGLNRDEELPGEQARRSREFEAAGKENPSTSELMDLSEDDVLPRSLHLPIPNSRDASNALSKFGAKEPETLAGRYAKRGGQFLGSGAAFGSNAVKAPLAMAAAGQTAEELGAPPWAQAATEIATALKLGRTSAPISSSSPAISKELKRLKEMGLSEKDLTLARNALEDRGWLKKSSKFTNEAENRFKETYSNMNKNVDSIIEGSFPGIKEGGSKAFKDIAVELYDNLDSFAREVPITKPQSFVNAADKAIEEMERTLAKSPQKNEAINMLQQAKERAAKNKDVAPGDFYTNFYKELNAIGKWNNPKQREAAFGAVKNAIKDTFKDQGPQGVKLANSLEEANTAWMKYLNARDVSKIMDKVTSDTGINFKKLKTVLERPDTMDTFKKGLGEKQANNLLKLADITSEIGNFEKAMKGGIAKDLLSHGTLYGITKGIISGDLGTLKTIIGVQAAGHLATKLLTDPSYQNLAIKMAQAAKDNKWHIVAAMSSAIESKNRADLSLNKKVDSNKNPK